MRRDQPQHAAEGNGVQPGRCRDFGNRAGPIAKRIGDTGFGQNMNTARDSVSIDQTPQSLSRRRFIHRSLHVWVSRITMLEFCWRGLLGGKAGGYTLT
jgi:hypothetical protein